MKSKLITFLTVITIGALLAIFASSCSAPKVCKTYAGTAKIQKRNFDKKFR